MIAQTAVAQDTNLLEEFVRSPDREVVLKKLVPGTQEYYFLHSLHYQNTQQLDKVDETLAAWEKRFNKKIFEMAANSESPNAAQVFRRSSGYVRFLEA